jgi:hypothetical protein
MSAQPHRCSDLHQRAKFVNSAQPSGPSFFNGLQVAEVAGACPLPRGFGDGGGAASLRVQAPPHACPHAPQWSPCRRRGWFWDRFMIGPGAPGRAVRAKLNRRIRPPAMLMSHLSIDRHAKYACRVPALNSGSLRKCGIKEGHQLRRHCRQSSSASRWKGASGPCVSQT